jgi:hypothetical protein
VDSGFDLTGSLFDTWHGISELGISKDAMEIYSSFKFALPETSENVTSFVGMTDILKGVSGILSCKKTSTSAFGKGRDLPAISKSTSSPPGCSSKNFVASYTGGSILKGDEGNTFVVDDYIEILLIGMFCYLIGQLASGIGKVGPPTKGKVGTTLWERRRLTSSYVKDSAIG